MTDKLRDSIEKIIKLSKESTLCVHYSLDPVTVSFKVEEELTLTEHNNGLGFSLWCENLNIATPNQITMNYSDIKSFEFVTSDEMRKRSNGECNVQSLEIKFDNGAEISIFEDVI